MAGQLSHFTYYAPKLSDVDHSYSRSRYAREYDRLVSVMDTQLASRAFLVHEEYSIADKAAWPWVKPWRRWMGRACMVFRRNWQITPFKLRELPRRAHATCSPAPPRCASAPKEHTSRACAQTLWAGP